MQNEKTNLNSFDRISSSLARIRELLTTSRHSVDSVLKSKSQTIVGAKTGLLLNFDRSDFRDPNFHFADIRNDIKKIVSETEICSN